MTTGEHLDWTPNIEHLKGHPKKGDHSHLDPLHGKIIEHVEGAGMQSGLGEDMGYFHATSAEMPENNLVKAFCGNITTK